MGLPLLRAAHHDGALPDDDADRLGAELPARRPDRGVYWDQWKGYNQLTRVKWDAAAGALDLATEQVIIKVEQQRGQCCHVAGDVDFDADGNLYLATGDNTPAGTPGANGFAPNNDAPGMNPGFDSRRGAGNTNDLRGKILRISVQDDGSYTIPAGNLFAPGTDRTRAEIFAMGLRNPFRIDVDPETNAVSWGEYGPDAGAPSAQRGPMGYVEWMTTAIDSRSTAAGRTARATPTTTSGTSPRRPRVSSSTARPAPRTTRAGTPVWPSCRPPRPRRSSTATTPPTSRGPS